MNAFNVMLMVGGILALAIGALIDEPVLMSLGFITFAVGVLA